MEKIYQVKYSLYEGKPYTQDFNSLTEAQLKIDEIKKAKRGNLFEIQLFEKNSIKI